MRKLKKLVLITAALGALAVGGAAFAGAQSAGTVAKVTVQKSSSAAEAAMSGDTDKVQSGEREAGAEKADAPDSASENDVPEGPGDQADGPSDGESPGS
jgi:hypothetical protein